MGGIWVLTGFLALAVWSRNTILTQLGKAWLFSPDHSETSKYQNVYIWGWQKWLGYIILLFLSARRKDIKNGSCKWSPCIAFWINLGVFASWPRDADKLKHPQFRRWENKPAVHQTFRDILSGFSIFDHICFFFQLFKCWNTSWSWLLLRGKAGAIQWTVFMF